MAHCPYDRLADLEPALAEIRTWDHIREASPGVFYIRRTPFLHFHVKGDTRWADARHGTNWGPPIDIPEGASPRACKAFLASVRDCYVETCAAVVKPPRKTPQP
ncbi:MAG TPA: hypothetical protein VEI97_12785 [bacterium]|nr:hypothetical protein [bacterium]